MRSQITVARKKKELSRKIIDAGEGLFAFAFDTVLFLSVYPVALLGAKKGDPASVHRATQEAQSFLGDSNYRAIKNAIITATKKGYVRSAQRNAFPEITEAGKHRLSEIIPSYDTKRIWDGQLHLITYDVPETKRYDRDTLRKYIRRIGCAKLQDSVWLTPYDPIDTLREYIDVEKLHGAVIISKLGRDASIGEEDLSSLIVRIYALKTLNKRYEFWLSAYKHGSIDQGGLVSYLAILKDDPQLPFSLLPPWWKGEEAYRRAQPLLEKLSTHLRPQKS